MKPCNNRLSRWWTKDWPFQTLQDKLVVLNLWILEYCSFTNTNSFKSPNNVDRPCKTKAWVDRIIQRLLIGNQFNAVGMAHHFSAEQGKGLSRDTVSLCLRHFGLKAHPAVTKSLISRKIKRTISTPVSTPELPLSWLGWHSPLCRCCLWGERENEGANGLVGVQSSEKKIKKSKAHTLSCRKG